MNHENGFMVGVRQGSVMEANIKRREREGERTGTDGWDGILRDFWRSWLATSSPFPPIPPNHNKAASLIEINKLILLQFAHTRTHEQVEYERVTAPTHTNTRTQYLHVNVDIVSPHLILHKHSVAIIIPDA